MSWAVIHTENGPVLIADERGENEYRRAHGITPYRDKAGNLVTEQDLKNQDKAGA